MTNNKKPDLVISEEEIADFVKPFAVDYGGQSLVLKSPTSLSLDDIFDVGKVAEDNVLKALEMVAGDEFTGKTLKAMPHPLLFKVFSAWEASGDVAAGESDGSEGSSETTEPQ